jgi:hypothetical protein
MGRLLLILCPERASQADDKGERRQFVDWTHMVIIAIVGATAVTQAISMAVIARELHYVASIAERILNKVE